jgi:hypothetical protein
MGSESMIWPADPARGPQPYRTHALAVLFWQRIVARIGHNPLPNKELADSIEVNS